MTEEAFRIELEEDLAWRLDELRSLRNSLLGDTHSHEDWPVHAMRAILVMQYAHLEGFTQNALSTYVAAINRSGLLSGDLKEEISAACLSTHFKQLRAPYSEEQSETNRLLSRAKRHVSFVRKVNELGKRPISIVPDDAVSLEMNLGSDVLRKNFYVLGLPESCLDKSTYGALEFVRTSRNDIAHGSRRFNIAPRMFEAHTRKCEEYMNQLIRVLWQAIREEWYRADPRSAPLGSTG